MPSNEKPGIYTLKAVFNSGPLTGTVTCEKQIQILSAGDAALAPADPDQRGPLSGKAAPELRADRWLQGQPTSLARLRGKVVLLDFWATWCVPCIAEFPTIQRFHQDNKNKGIAVISLVVADDPEAALKQLIRKHRITFPVLMDSEPPAGKSMGATFNAYRVRALPRQVVIDQQGIVRYNGQNLEEALRIARELTKKPGM